MIPGGGAILQDEHAIFLVGFMGSGKSTLGPLLAAELGWKAFDTDALVERREGRRIESIFRESGEPHFRRVEREVLHSLGDTQRSVVASGGGLFLGAAQRRWMWRQGRTVWLDVPLGECLQRIGTGGGRPNWTPEEPTAFRALYERRRAVYALAQVRIRGAAEPPEETARRVLGRLDAVFR